MPQGRFLEFIIYSTHGDKHYVGLSGIEIFDDIGQQIQLENPKQQVRAEPSDVNSLPGYSNDPRTCDKLIDGTYRTCDDLHVWLSPFQPEKKNFIYIDLNQEIQISMIRIWNYNKSRIHSFRGAKHIEILFDTKTIFSGEIQKAPGVLKNSEKFCEYIMFTDDDGIIELIDINDWINRISNEENEELEQSQMLDRPGTGDKKNKNTKKELSDNPFTSITADGRPITAARVKTNKKPKTTQKQDTKEIKQTGKQLNKQANEIVSSQFFETLKAKKFKGIECTKLTINIVKSWDDEFYVGLTGFEILDQKGKKLNINIKNLDAKPRDMNDIPGYSGDHRTLDKLIDGVNITTNDKHMWLIPYVQGKINTIKDLLGQNHLIHIDLKSPYIVSGIRFWNYNKTVCDTSRGVQIVTIKADQQLVTPQSGVLLRKAQGNENFDYGQLVQIPYQNGWDDRQKEAIRIPNKNQIVQDIVQEYHTIHNPKGFNFKFKILSTWGDFHYCGLNGIDFYDHKGDRIIQNQLCEFKIAADPSSVNILEGCELDCRTVDKLVNNINDTYDDKNMWLSPYINLNEKEKDLGKQNSIFILFENLVMITAINIWNYSKTPNRGVREIEIYLDDKLIYKGYIRKAPVQKEKSVKYPQYTTILFNKTPQILNKISPSVYSEDNQQQQVLMYNENKLTNKKQQVQQSDIQPSIVGLERPDTIVQG